MKIVTVHLRNKMNLSTQRLKKTFYRNQEHPYSIFEKIIRDYLQENCVMLDIGCGREAPVLQKFGGDCKTLIGMDISEIKKTRDDGRINFIVGDLVNIGLQSNSVVLQIQHATGYWKHSYFSRFQGESNFVVGSISFIFHVQPLAFYGGYGL